MISRARGPFLKMRAAFYWYIDDVDEIHGRAVEYGANVDFEPTDMDYQVRLSGIIIPAATIGGFQNDLKKKANTNDKN